MNLKRIIQTFVSVIALIPTLALGLPQINGTLGFIPFGANASFTGSNLTNATSFSFAASAGTGILGVDINTVGLHESTCRRNARSKRLAETPQAS